MPESMTEAEYHAHPALSYSVGKLLLRSPQHYLHRLANREESTEFDIGHVIHGLVLGIGSDVVEIPHDSYRTKEARALRDAAYTEGKVPIKTADLQPARDAAEAVLAHPTARGWLEREGPVEQSLFAEDPTTGVAIRGKIDKLATVRDYDYDLQAAMYRHLIAVGLGGNPGPGVLIAVEKQPPYGVACYQLAHEDFIASGDLKLRTILARAAALRDDPDAWRGYPLGTHVLTPPPYYLTDLEERLAS